jgi:N-methylhydantoinase A/oxoprolinase/acetone carboxylase beta subunit
MPLLLGIDTGGTFTDAALFDEARGVVAKAKALTTHSDLAKGIGAAVAAALAQSGEAAERIALVSLSTTLATNAMVEGQGGRVGLVFIGFDPADAERPDLRSALHGDPVITVAGGHDPFGEERAPLDLATLSSEARRQAPALSGFAVTARFGTLNPTHEIAARDLLRRETGLPVTCGHELSARLDGPKRALTAVLNARLIHLLEALVAATEEQLGAQGIVAPLMVVRGDGALVAANIARTKPIETIFSGPAASVIGGAFLAGLSDAVVADIGGTTTDVAILRGGRPRLDPEGAIVGGYRTMVEAIAIRTCGLGGDSEVGLGSHGTEAILTLGPRRVLPVSCSPPTSRASYTRLSTGRLSPTSRTISTGASSSRLRLKATGWPRSRRSCWSVWAGDRRPLTGCSAVVARRAPSSGSSRAGS